jgi:uncharacterized protein (DUF1697 family)
MAELRIVLEKMNFKNITTILNSGNIIFDAASKEATQLEITIAKKLESTFGFPVPTIIRTHEMISHLLANNPFEGIELTKDLRFYVSFLKNEVETDLQIPWTNDDESYKILSEKDKTIASVLDVSVYSTPKSMANLEKFYGKDITTRNWNTLLRIAKKI